MKNFASVSLITCLVLQLAPLRTVGGISTSSLADAISEFTNVSLYHIQHKRELLKIKAPIEDEAAPANALQLSLFVHKRTRELLSEAWRPQARRIARVILEEANRHQLDPLLIMSVIHQESSFRPTVVGRHGEVGLMQMRPETAKWMIKQDMIEAPAQKNLAKALKDPVVNVRFGAAYLGYLRKSFDGKARLFLSAYNMGAANVRTLLKRGDRPANYVGRIVTHYKRFNSGLEKFEVQPVRQLAGAGSTLVAE